MLTDYIQLLERHDDPVLAEYPDGFNYKEAERRFYEFVTDFAGQWDRPLDSETGVLIQDASFHGLIRVPLVNDEHVSVWFSNFGDMATFAEEVTVPDSLKQTLITLFEKHRYVYIPYEILEKPYSGKIPGVTGFKTWWRRSFDWI